MASVDLAPEVVEMLSRGAADGLGIVCRPGEVRKLYPLLHEAERLGYIRFIDLERPWITEAGRAAIGAPSQAEVDRAKLALICSNARKPLVPAKRDDPRTAAEYTAWNLKPKWACTLVVRQPDARHQPRSIRVGRTLTSEAQYLGSNNANVQPESTDRFVLAVVPEWMTRPIKKAGGVTAPAIFSTWPLALDESDPNFTDEDRETWLRLRQVCASINSRIRIAGKPSHQKSWAYGQWA